MAETAIFDPPPGIRLGDSDYSLPGRYTAGNNVRFVDGRAQPIGGWSATLTFTTDRYVSIFEWLDAAGTSNIVLGGLTKVHLKRGAVNVAITPAGFTSTMRWSFDVWGEYLIGCPTGGTIHQWDLNTASDLTPLSNAPGNVTIAGVADTRQLFAFGCNAEAAPSAFDGRCIRWSDIENNNDWTTTPSNLAGEYVLDGAGGNIRARAKIGPNWAVWTDDELFLGRFTGEPSNPWVFERQASGCGCLGMDAATVVDGTAYWITRDLRLMGWVIGAPPFQLPGIPTYYITSPEGADVDKTGMVNSFVWHNRTFNEIWFHYVVEGSTYPTRYIAVSVDSLRGGDPVWFPGTLNRAAMHQGVTGIHGSRADQEDQFLYSHEIGRQGGPTDNLSWSLSALAYVDKGQRRIEIQRLIPDIKDQVGNVTFTLSKLDYPQGAETTLHVKTLTPGEDKSDFRGGGKLFRFAWSGNDGSGGTDTFARFGKQVFDYVAEGER